MGPVASRQQSVLLLRAAVAAWKGSDGEREGLLAWCIAEPAGLTRPPPSLQLRHWVDQACDARRE